MDSEHLCKNQQSCYCSQLYALINFQASFVFHILYHMATCQCISNMIAMVFMSMVWSHAFI